MPISRKPKGVTEMSYLEKKAKTIKDFYQDCICQIVSKGKHPRQFDESQKWVPLEDAHKAVVEKNLERFKEIKELEAKIEAANKILNAYCKDGEYTKCARFVKGECSLKLPKSCFVKSIRDALLFPRKEEAKTNES
jgi:hypothetical protein